MMRHNPMRHRGSKRLGLQRSIVEPTMRKRVGGVLVRGSEVNTAWMRSQRMLANDLFYVH